MENQNLAQRVKELRKRKALSQDDLAKNAGLSLRTVQRVENGDTIPTAETLKRLAVVLDVAPNELTDLIIDGETAKQKVKTKFEYLHIFDSKLVFSKTPEVNLVEDYKTSVDGILRFSMGLFINITMLLYAAFVFYNKHKMDLAFLTISFALLIFTLLFYIMFFNSMTPTIDIRTIRSITIKKYFFDAAGVEIYFIESGRIKGRGLILRKDQFNEMIDKVLAEKLVSQSDIKHNSITKFLRPLILFFVPAVFLQTIIFSHFLKSPQYYQSVIFFILSLLLIIKMLKDSVFLSKETLNKGFIQKEKSWITKTIKS